MRCVKETQAAEDGVQFLNDRKDGTKLTLGRSCAQSKHSLSTGIGKDSNGSHFMQVSTTSLDQAGQGRILQYLREHGVWYHKILSRGKKLVGRRIIKSVECKQLVFLLARVYKGGVWGFGKLMIVIWNQEGFLGSAAC